FGVVGAGVELGAGTRLLSHAVVLGPARLGAGNVVHPFAALGGAPQDRSYRGEPTELWVGDGNVFREHVTVHRGTAKDRGLTRIGHHGLFLAGCHVAHDATVGDHVTLANATLLGGHVVVDDHVATGGHTAVQPFVHLGESCFLAGGAMVERDVPPFVIAAGDRARVRALNRVGLGRRDVPPDSMEALDSAFRLLFGRQLTRAAALDRLRGATDPWVRRLVDFLDAGRPTG
ncbi:MAG: acyl-ACP--UDP-N-acetylglucosamine O-acyltransferase, partial [Myxococcales bacterium]